MGGGHFSLKLRLVPRFYWGSEYSVITNSLDLCQSILFLYVFLILNNIILLNNLNIYFVQMNNFKLQFIVHFWISISQSKYVIFDIKNNKRVYSVKISIIFVFGKKFKNISNTFEIFWIEFYRIYRIYRICRKLFLVMLKMKWLKIVFYKFYRFCRFYRIQLEKTQLITLLLLFCSQENNKIIYHVYEYKYFTYTPWSQVWIVLWWRTLQYQIFGTCWGKW